MSAVRHSLLPLMLVIGAGACGHSDAELQAAYRDGHRGGIIWCKREEAATSPDIDPTLLAEWRRGFEESAGIQCPAKARKIAW